MCGVLQTFLFFSDFAIFEIFWPIFFDDMLNIGLFPPPETPSSKVWQIYEYLLQKIAS